jgi:hypothetical protein
MKVFDVKTTTNIWEKKHTIMIEEKDKSVISQDQLHEIMLKTACNNLAIELMNLFMRDYSSIMQK